MATQPNTSPAKAKPFARPAIDGIYTPGTQWEQDPAGAIEPIVVQSGHFAGKAAKAIRDCGDFLVFKMTGEVRELRRIDGSLRAREISGERMRVVLDSCVGLVQTKLIEGTKNQAPYIRTTPVIASLDNAKVAISELAAGDHLRELHTIRDYPSYLPGWSMTQPGHNGGGYFYDEPLDLELLSKATKWVKPEKCRKWLDDLLVDFPFRKNCDKTHFIALMLTLLCKPAIDGNTPFFLVQASRERTGKSKLINEVLGPTIFGRAPWNNTLPKNEEELHKTLISILASGQPYVFFDNIEKELGGDLLCSALTSQSIAARILGTTNQTTIKNHAVMLGTGNNCTLAKDMNGRTLELTLVPEDDRPEQRTGFEHPDIAEYALKHRVKTLFVLRSMIENWKDAGSPRYKDKTIGGFERWTRTIGSILKVNGYTDFLDGWELQRPEADDYIADFFEAMWHQANLDPKKRDNNAKSFVWMGSHVAAPVKDGLEKFCREQDYFAGVYEGRFGEASIRTALGKALKRIEGRPINTKHGVLCLQQTGTRPARWALRPWSGKATA